MLARKVFDLLVRFRQRNNWTSKRRRIFDYRSYTFLATNSVPNPGQNGTPTFPVFCYADNQRFRHSKAYSTLHFQRQCSASYYIHRCLSNQSDANPNTKSASRPIRRRRVRGAATTSSENSSNPPANDETPESSPISGQNVMKPAGVRDTILFSETAETFLIKLENRLRPMQNCNDVFEITRIPRDYSGGQLTIRLQPKHGMYNFIVDEDNFAIIFSSPISGSYTYVLCSHTGKWLGEDDSHDLEGLLVRDLIRQCNGFPSL